MRGKDNYICLGNDSCDSRVGCAVPGRAHALLHSETSIQPVILGITLSNLAYTDFHTAVCRCCDLATP